MYIQKNQEYGLTIDIGTSGLVMYDRRQTNQKATSWHRNNINRHVFLSLMAAEA